MRAPEERYFDRELSWLAFNERVLQEAADPRVPLLERLKFLAIYSSNLDEFFRVRVATLRTVMRGSHGKLEEIGINTDRLLSAIHQTVDRQQRRFGEIFRRDIVPGLESEGIILHEAGSYPDGRLEHIRRLFRDRLAEHVNPVVLDSYSEPPFLKNAGLYLIVPLWPRRGHDPVFAQRAQYGLVDIPSEHVDRFVQISRDHRGRHVMFIDDVIRLTLDEIFPRHDVVDAYAVKLTRDAELHIDDEFSGDLLDILRRSLKQRETGIPTRFLYDQRMPYPVVTALKKVFDLADEDLVLGGFYHNFSDFFRFPDFGRADLCFQPLAPLRHEQLGASESILAETRRRDAIVHFPFHDFDPVVRFVSEAASDPEVQSVSATLYRVARDSQVVSGLIDAATNGKKVSAFVEVRARFDEEHNISWVERMRDAGIRVSYGLPGLKVHAKMLLVKSRAGDVCFLSTGNFNEKTARVYSDIGMFTADPRITEEVNAVFRRLEDPHAEARFKHLLVAPTRLREGLSKQIDREIRIAREGGEAWMILKMNSLEDERMIDLLYEASQQGVRVDLIVRGICRLRPGIHGLSDNIGCISIVDRFLEHARIFAFGNGGKPICYLASADWMSRNLNRRVEIAWPVFDESIRDYLLIVLRMQLDDDTKARRVDSRQSNEYVSRGVGTRRSQLDNYALLASSDLSQRKTGPG